MPLVRLQTRKAFRAVLEDVRDRYVAKLKAWGPAGGSIWAQVARIKVKLKRWGGVWATSEAGQKLTWFVRGTKHQPERPVDVEINDTLARELVHTEAAEILDRYDREAR